MSREHYQSATSIKGNRKFSHQWINEKKGVRDRVKKISAHFQTFSGKVGGGMKKWELLKIFQFRHVYKGGGVWCIMS